MSLEMGLFVRAGVFVYRAALLNKWKEKYRKLHVSGVCCFPSVGSGKKQNTAAAQTSTVNRAEYSQRSRAHTCVSQTLTQVYGMHAMNAR